MKLLYIIGILTVLGDRVAMAVRFGHPYFLILSDESSTKNVLIETDSCMSGAFSNAKIKLTKFCVTGIWVLLDGDCATDSSQTYIVSGKESCFELPTAIEAKRFMPILQNIEDFEGFAFALPNTYNYFVRLNPNNRTAMKPISQPRGDWTVMTVNFGLFRRHVNEFVAMAGDQVGLQTCYAPQDAVVTQFYKMKGDGDTIFEPFKDSEDCRTGFNSTPQSFNIPTGSVRSLHVGDEDMYNSTGSYVHKQLEPVDIVVPFLAATVSGPCGGETAVTYPPYNTTAPYDKFPLFPHSFPSSDMDDVIADEIQETAQRYIERKLFSTPVKAINRTEYSYVIYATKILGRFCCNTNIKAKDLDSIRTLFRLSTIYYFQYHPYEELKNEQEEIRILSALNACLNRTDFADMCVTVEDATSCPTYINSTSLNKTTYEFEMPADIQFELGNLDYVTEAIWKSMLFAHYYCAPFFETPSDHSAFNVKIEGFFNPLVKTKWTKPKGVHTVYELLLNEINLKAVAETIDHCVDTAHQTSEYTNWLDRPDSIAYTRKKRDTKENGASEVENNCVPQTTPKLFCLDKQFDVYDKKLLNPFQVTPACNNAYSKKQEYKYIHANSFGSSY